MDLDLGGKVFIVSGGTSGLGAAVAAGLVGEGARVVGLATDLRGATTPPPAARQSFGRLDGAFVSHGGPDPGPATDLDDARLCRAMESAVVAPIALIREIVRELPSGGAVVALTSSTGVGADGRHGRVQRRTRCGARIRQDDRDRGRHPWRSGQRVDPWPLTAARLQQIAAEGTAEHRGGRHGNPMDRDGNPTELVAAACLLLSSRSSFVTGSAWTVDGGRRRTL